MCNAEKALEFDEHSVMCLLPRNSMNNIILKITISVRHMEINVTICKMRNIGIAGEEIFEIDKFLSSVAHSSMVSLKLSPISNKNIPPFQSFSKP
jgi:hypothetical protein